VENLLLRFGGRRWNKERGLRMVASAVLMIVGLGMLAVGIETKSPIAVVGATEGLAGVYLAFKNVVESGND